MLIRVAHFSLFVCLGALPTAACADEPVSFSRDILPVLSDNCFHCHGPDPKRREADLRLDVREAAVESGAVTPGKSSESELVRRIASTDADERMPPADSNRKLSAEQIALVTRWIDEGASWGRHWAYEPIRRPEVPKVRDTAWVRTPIDAFILARLEKEKLAPSPEADAETLCRRLYLDLTGLPPTPEEVDAFVASFPLSPSPLVSPSGNERGGDKEIRGEGDKEIRGAGDAYEQLVDSLLASPRYGERWAWDWLDAARYADTGGYQGDPERTMWPWRDWVVDAINRNMPYDQFTIEQLAGDLLPHATQAQRVATAFNRNHMFNAEGGRIAEETRVENVMDRTETVATVWLGLTVGCARCHDHKFDPITNRDYYQFYAYFNNTSETGGGRSGQAPPVIDFATDADREALKSLEAKVAAAGAAVELLESKRFPREANLPASKSPAAADLSGNVQAALGQSPAKRGSDSLREMAAFFQDRDQEYGKALTALKSAVDARDRHGDSLPRVMVMDEMPQRRESFILVKGAYDKPADKVEMGLPSSLPPLPAGEPNNRLGMARWLVDKSNPLTARVTVNRYWQSLFGVGLVKTVEDFGVQGERPSHPELLDWLASEFIESGWDVKRLHKLIISSAVYRQSSKAPRALWERDPENRLLARGARFRLPSWMIRDSALAASGLLVDKRGGPSVKPYQPEGIWEEATFGKKTYAQDHGEALYRRSLYVYWRRIVGPTTLFDTAARQVCTIKSVRTNTPLHALTTLNDVTYVEAARALAERAMKHGGSKAEERLAWSFRTCTARRPTADESAVLSASFAKVRRQFAGDRSAAEKLLNVGEAPRDESLDPIEHAAYTTICTMILNLDEVLTKQ